MLIRRKSGSLRDGIAAILLAGSLLLLALVLAALEFARDAQEEGRRVLEASRISGRVVRLLALIQDAETSQRGYFITSDTHYLAPFDTAEQSIVAHLGRLRRDLGTIGADQPTIERLNELVMQKLDELRETIDLKRSGREAQAIALIREGRGLRLMDELRQIFDRLEALSQNTALTEIRTLRSISFNLILSIVGGAGLLILLIGGGTVLAVIVFRQIERARLALAAQNDVLEARVRARTAFLERANKEIQNFAYIVSHDLKAPLVNISGFASELERAAEVIGRYMDQRLKDGGPPDDPLARAASEAVREDVPEALRFIRSSITRMDDLIAAILRLSRAGTRPLQPEQVSLSDLFRACASAVQRQIDEAGATVTIPASLPAVVSDRLALQQIFANLLDNCLKYADPQRALFVSVSAERRGQTVTVSIADTGRGIAAHDLERVFDLFRRSGPQTRPGEGIGLAHVRTLCRRLGGDVVAGSTQGEGSVFTWTIAADLRSVAERGESDVGIEAGHDRDDRG
ncbi:sensor histidine kinase [Ensifer soli]|uniref:sensor histidine kinase n=1 Tax=Ciceribacter sp. sgz301302 TaxID=3342379 RepID=UPI0035B844B3